MTPRYEPNGTTRRGLITTPNREDVWRSTDRRVHTGVESTGRGRAENDAATRDEVGDCTSAVARRRRGDAGTGRRSSSLGTPDRRGSALCPCDGASRHERGASPRCSERSRGCSGATHRMGWIGCSARPGTVRPARSRRARCSGSCSPRAGPPASSTPRRRSGSPWAPSSPHSTRWGWTVEAVFGGRIGPSIGADATRLAPAKRRLSRPATRAGSASRGRRARSRSGCSVPASAGGSSAARGA